VIVSFSRDRYPERYLRLGLTEKNVQALVLARLRKHCCWVHVVDAGAAKLRGRAFGALRRAGASTAALAGGTGVKRGITDIVGITGDGRPLFVEVKAPEHLAPSSKTGRLVQVEEAGEPTSQQIAFVTEAAKRGAAAGFAWADTDVDEILGVGRRA
jgi:hypothetical protein